MMKNKLSINFSVHLMFFSMLIIPIPLASSLSFDLNGFDQKDNLIYNESHATFNGSEINLTQYRLQNATGRVEYGEPLLLWNSENRRLIDFSTRFSFVINSFGQSAFADGLAFFLSPFNDSRPPYPIGGNFGLFRHGTLTDSTFPTVAVEFDTYSNNWDPKYVHVGIDINSIVSNVTAQWQADDEIKAGREATAWVSYNSITHNLSVLVSYASDPASAAGIFLIVDQRDVLPEKVGMGFSASTGGLTETHTLLSWSFNSSTFQLPPKSKGRLRIWIRAVASAIAVAVLLLVLFLIWSYKGLNIHDPLNAQLAREAGPRAFSYRKLASATRHFSEAVKLGGGGFGSVYHGRLDSRDVAVKRVSSDSAQGINEYIAEVTIISRLRHGNLVELVGWCHRRLRKEYLLVYKFMPNRSLDKHLYDPADCMPWPRRYNIAMGLAAALRYLHHECQPNVVHRDVKPSNVMLDSNFNAKLGDFGLARKLDQGEEYRQATLLIGTPFYVAPEYHRDWRFSRKTDVYSFGIVALEIASGKSIQVDNHLVSWVRNLYDSGQIQTAADPRLNGQFDADEMKRLLVVGLWCSHPDYVLRPTMQEAIPFLEGPPLPELPPARPSQEYHLYRRPSDEIFASALSNFTTGTAAIMPAPTSSLNLAAPAPSSTAFFSTQLDD